jgi:valyl-tRNA synthetase
VIPFVTEALWSQLDDELLMASPFPDPDPALRDEGAETEVAQLVEVVTALRGWRDSVGAKPSLVVRARLEGHAETREHIARLARLEYADGQEVAAVGPVAILETEGLDLAAAAERVEKQRDKLRAEIARAEQKLSNEKFVANAPAEVVDGERAKLAALQRELAELA